MTFQKTLPKESDTGSEGAQKFGQSRCDSRPPVGSLRVYSESPVGTLCGAFRAAAIAEGGFYPRGIRETL